MVLSEQKRTRYFWLQQACATFGLLCSLYLLIQHTRLKSGIQDSASFCSISAFVNCDVVNASRFSEIGGIPLATLGCIYFFTLLLLGFLAPPKDKAFTTVQTILAWMAAAGLALDLFLFLLWQLIFLKTICIVCIASYFAVYFHWYFNIRSFENMPQNFFKAMMVSLKRPIALNASLFPKFKYIVGGLALGSFMLVIFLLPYFIRSGATQSQMPESEIQQFYAEWKQRTSKKINVPSHAPSYGNPNGKVQVVVFSDFECPFCHKAAFTLHTGLRPFKDSIDLRFVNFPLDASCNPLMTYQLHAYACRLARLGLCANEKGEFWDFHDFVFMEMDESHFKSGSDVLYAELKDTFSPQEIQMCLGNPKNLRQVEEDIQLGNQYEVRGTPSIFINGKRVTVPLTVETLSKLISMEL